MPMFNFGGQAQVPQQAQPQGGGFLQQLLAPENAMPIAAALMGQQGNGQNFSNAMSAYGQTAAQTAGKNKTLDFFRKQAPEFAEMVDAGMPVTEAWQTYTQQRYAKEPKGSGLINAGDGNIYDPNKGEWLTAPQNGAASALFDGKSVQAQGLNYLIQTGELTKGQASQLAAGKTITDPSTGAVMFMTPQGLVSQPANSDPNGTGANTLTGPKKPDNTEYATAIYADRMANSGKIIDSLAGAGTSLQDSMASGMPFGNYMISKDYQKFDQAQRDFVNAVLRRESGAVISDEEFDNARKQYLPQPGDTTEVLAQKRVNRQIAIDGMKRASGPGMPQSGAPATQNGGWTDAGGGVKIRRK